MKEQLLKEFKEWIKCQPIQMSLSWTKRAAAYIRVSTDKQTELSPISQLKEIYKYAVNNQLYLDFENIFIEEEGISAKDSQLSKRTEFNNMIALAKEKEKRFDVIIVWKFSRFARSQEQSIIFKNLLKKEHEIDVKSVSEPVIDGPFGQLIERIIEWSDEYYLINLSQEVQRGMTEAANLGKFMASAPFGYCWNEHKLVVKDDEAKIIKLIFQKYANNEMTMIEIARYVNSLGFKTKRGGSFENRTIQYILLNPIYKGYTRWTPKGKLKREELFSNKRSIIVKSNHEPIVDEELWNKAYKKLEEYLAYHVKRQRYSSDPWSWLKGLIRCGECGRTLIRIEKKLRCNGYNKGSCLCGDLLDIKEVEEKILNEIRHYYEFPFQIKYVANAKKKDDSNELDLLNNQLSFVEIKEKRIKAAYINGIDSIEEYKQNKKDLEIEKERLLNQLKELSSKEKKSSNIEIKENLRKAYEVLTDESLEMKNKYMIAHALINKVEYKDGVLSLYFNEI